LPERVRSSVGIAPDSSCTGNGSRDGFFVIAHDRRRVLHFNVTKHPTSDRVSQQLREAIPYDSAPRYLVHDRDAIFNTDVVETIKAIGIKPARTSFKSPWQKGIAERFAGCCRRDLLDHVTVVDERHLKRLMRDSVRYLHEDRTHLGLSKDTPAGRVKESNPSASCRLWLGRDWAACIIATNLLLEPPEHLKFKEGGAGGVCLLLHRVSR
jgi:hypothetical protein